jgi:iron complex transport system permease protein
VVVGGHDFTTVDTHRTSGLPPKTVRPNPGWSLRMLLFAGLLAALVLAFLVSIAVGSVLIPLDARILAGQDPTRATWKTIVMDLRVPRTITAMIAGAALGVAGLQMQTLFRNALADPYILGVSTGASLGVALVVLSAGAATSGLLAGIGLLRNVSAVGAAALGSLAVLSLMMSVASWVRSPVVVLVVGVMVGAFTYAIVSVLIYFSTPESVQAFSAWGFGSFQGVSWQQLPVFVPAVLVGLLLAALTTKQLNALLLGENYARSMGLSVRRMRILSMLSAALAAGSVTAFCGPIAFLGIAIPHLARGVFRTSDHRVLVPAAVLLGAILALVCGIVAQMPGRNVVLPLNAATALLGAPVVTWVLLRMRRSVESLSS